MSDNKNQLAKLFLSIIQSTPAIHDSRQILSQTPDLNLQLAFQAVKVFPHNPSQNMYQSGHPEFYSQYISYQTLQQFLEQNQESGSIPLGHLIYLAQRYKATNPSQGIDIECFKRIVLPLDFVPNPFINETLNGQTVQTIYDIFHCHIQAVVNTHDALFHLIRKEGLTVEECFNFVKNDIQGELSYTNMHSFLSSTLNHNLLEHEYMLLQVYSNVTPDSKTPLRVNDFSRIISKKFDLEIQDPRKEVKQNRSSVYVNEYQSKQQKSDVVIQQQTNNGSSSSKKQPKTVNPDAKIIRVDNQQVLKNMEQIALNSISTVPVTNNSSEYLSQTIRQSRYFTARTDRDLQTHDDSDARVYNEPQALKIDNQIEPMIDECEEQLKQTTFFNKEENKPVTLDNLYQEKRDLYKFTMPKQEDCSILNDKKEFMEGSKEPGFLSKWFGSLKIEDSELTQSKTTRESAKKTTIEDETKKKLTMVQHDLSEVENGMVQKSDKKDKQKEQNLSEQRPNAFEISIKFDDRLTRQYKSKKFVESNFQLNF